MHTLKGKTCIITGASRGIGLAVATRFARAGARLFITARTPEPLSTAVAKLRAMGAECEGAPADVSRLDAATSIVDATVRLFGGLDILINNAGVAPLKPIEHMTDEEFRETIDTNIGGVFSLTRAAWPALAVQGGVIVNISSVSSIDPFAGFAVYGASKAWVNAFTKAVAAEGAPQNVRAYAVAPGAVETALLRSRFPDLPAQQVLSPDDVAKLIEQLCGPEPKHASGETVFIRR